jgi:hypothetical protein
MIRKFYIDFKENPQIGDNIGFILRDALGIIPFINSEQVFDINFGSGNIMPNQAAIGINLSATLTNLLSQLNMGWGVNYTNGLAQTTILTYAIVNNSIEITINYQGRNIISDVFSNERMFFRTDQPCQNYVMQSSLTSVLGIGNSFLSETAIISAFFNLTNVVKIINFNLNQTSIRRFDSVFARGVLFSINSNPESTDTGFPFFVYESIGNTAQPYITDNTLFIPIPNAISIPNNAFEFSINNGEDWQTTPQFNGIPDGEITLLVRDSLGCESTFNLFNQGQTNLTPIEPNIYFSESNTLRVVKRGGLPNIYNTLSGEEKANPAYNYCQKFKIGETIKTQFKTSYQNITVNFGDIQKIIANIGIADNRDAVYFTNENRLCLMFMSGNIYIDGLEIPYDLNGNLTEWAIIGNFVTTIYGLVIIENIGTLPDGRQVIQTNLPLTLFAEFTDLVSCTFNREIYDIYEHTMTYDGSVDRIIFDFDGEETHLSECICELEDDHALLIEWKNSKNTDVYFASGISFFGYFCEYFMSELADGDVEILKSDDKVFTIRNRDYKSVELKIYNLTTGMLRKMKVALKHDELKINDLFYKLAQDVEVERLSSSNLYTLTATLLESGEPFSTSTGLSVFEGEVPRLLEYDNSKYIKI